MQQAEAMSLEQIQAFLDGSESVEFQAESRAARHPLFEAVLRQHHYAELGRPEKGLVRRFLHKLSGLSRAQTTRLIGQFLRGRTVRPSVYRRRRFPTRSTRATSVLLARVDEAPRQLAGPATCAILRREFQLYGRREFRRLAGLSVAHLYNLRHSRLYRQQRLRVDKTRPTPDAHRDRRTPPAGSPGSSGLCTPRHAPRTRAGR